METIFDLLKMFGIGVIAGAIYIALFMKNKNTSKKNKEYFSKKEED